MNGERIIELFFARSEQAIAELDRQYGPLCHNLSYSIVSNHADAEECVNDAYLGAWNTIPPERPNPLLAFVCKIVRNLSIKRYMYNTAAKRSSTYTVALDELSDCLASPICVEEEITAKELTKEIETFLDSLSKENRTIFLRRYWFADSYTAIANQVCMSEKNVSVRLARIRKDLRVFLRERGYL